MLLIVTLTLVLLLFVYALYRQLRMPLLAKIAWRNIWRRKSSALFIIMGTLVATSMVASSLAVGDTLKDSFYKSVLDQLGELDEVVVTQAASEQVNFFSVETVKNVFFPEAIVDYMQTQKSLVIESYLPALLGYMSAEHLENGTDAVLSTESSVSVIGSRLEDFRGFTHNQILPDFTLDECAVSDTLAQKLGLEVGSHLKLYLWGVDKSFTVRAIIARKEFPSISMQGYTVLVNLDSVYALLQSFKTSIKFLPDEYLQLMTQSTSYREEIDIFRNIFDTLPPNPINMIMVSNRGDSYHGAPYSAQAKADLERFISQYQEEHPEYREITFNVHEAKAQGQQLADTVGKAFSFLFLILGSFSIVAGIVLIINIFTLLGEERKQEIGLMRSLGIRRGTIAELFLLEGLSYSVVSAVLGALLGTAATYLLITLGKHVTTRFSFIPDTFSINFYMQPAHLLLAISLGILITCVTVLTTSIRISRMEIVSALRDLPSHEIRRVSRSSILLSIGVGVSGILMLLVGAMVHTLRPELWLLGPCVMIGGVALVLRQILPEKWVMTLASVLVLGCTALAPKWIPDFYNAPGSFVLTGLLLLTAAVVVVVFHDRVLTRPIVWLFSSIPKWAALIKLAIAYPLSSRLRSGLTIFMYAIVLFSVTLISVMKMVQQQNFATMREKAVGQYDLRLRFNIPNLTVELNHALQDEHLLERPDIDRVQIEREFVAYLPQVEGFDRHGASLAIVPLLAVDQSSLDDLQSKTLIEKLPEFASDQAVWERLMTDPLTIVMGYIGDSDAASSHTFDQLGQSVTVCDGDQHEHCSERIIIAKVSEDRLYASASSVESDFGISRYELPAQYLIEVAEGADVAAVKADLEKALVRFGAEAVDLKGQFESQLVFMRTFFNLMEYYLALGLIIGICGLAVVMIRSVYERRHQIGIVRAIGFQRLDVVFSIVIETLVMSLIGVAVGVTLGVVTSYMITLHAYTGQGDQSAQFVIPYFELGLIAGLSLFFSLIASIYPAYLAGKIAPAEAMRHLE